jgi:hypothetical protein
MVTEANLLSRDNNELATTSASGSVGVIPGENRVEVLEAVPMASQTEQFESRSPEGSPIVSDGSVSVSESESQEPIEQIGYQENDARLPDSRSYLAASGISGLVDHGPLGLMSNFQQGQQNMRNSSDPPWLSRIQRIMQQEVRHNGRTSAETRNENSLSRARFCRWTVNVRLRSDGELESDEERE